MTIDGIEKEKKKWRVKDALGFLCHAGVYVFLFFFVVIYSFYAPKGYIQIATHKYLFFRKMCTITACIMIPLILLYSLAPPFEKNIHKMAERVSSTDIYVLLFLAVNIVSYIGTPYRDEALWGTDGWYMGFAMQLFFIGTYFLVSRFYDWKIDVLPAFMVTAGVLFLWGILNRFSVYPIEMHYHSPQFISSMGNINWFCGFWSVFFVIGVVLYLITDKAWMRVLSGVYSIIALGLGAVEGSDSAFLSMGVVFFFLFLVSFQKTEYMKRLLEEGMFYCGACQVMRVIAKLSPERLDVDGFETVMKIMLGNLTLITFVILLILRVFLEKKDREYKKSIVEKAGKIKDIGNKEDIRTTDSKELVQNWINLKSIVIRILITAVIIYLIMLAVNTRAPGILGPLSKYYKVFLFNGSWGSSRGATWMDGFAIFKTLSWRQRLFGIGQDCFAIYGYSMPEMAARLKEEWGESRLTNAHNECITHLVNIGIFGVISFVSMFWNSFRRLLQKAKKQPLCYVFAASLLSYFCHNQFSFAQVLNTPYIYLMLGIGESLMRRERGTGAG